jgi:copper chaperone NosL
VTSRLLGPLLLVLTLLAACDDQAPTSRPPPVEVTENAVGHYCGMLLAEHAGPKGQAHLRSRSEPIWFSSARDALIFTRLPEEPRDIAAVYVSDMVKAGSWERPQPDGWVEVNDAWFVIDSDRRGGMGGPEAVPFSREDAAMAFAAEHGGRLVRLAEVPDAYLLDPGAPDEESGHATH